MPSSTATAQHASSPTRSKSLGRAHDSSSSKGYGKNSKGKQGGNVSPPYRDVIDKLDLSGLLGGGCESLHVLIFGVYCCFWLSKSRNKTGRRQASAYTLLQAYIQDMLLTYPSLLSALNRPPRPSNIVNHLSVHHR